MPELDRTIATDAGIRRASFGMFHEERIDDLALEFFRQIDDVQGNAEILRHRRRPRDVLRRTALAWQNLSERRSERVGPEREAHGDDVVPFLFEEVCERG